MGGRVVFVIGVSGCGKSTVARALAESSGGQFLEGDAFHSPENIAKMRAGHPLSDDMRWGWLDDLATAADAQAANGHNVFVACSALKRIYRDRLRAKVGPCTMILLDGQRLVILDRLNSRTDHYMPPGLLDSQFRDLELPDAFEENMFCIDADQTPDAVLSAALTIAFSPIN
jgi:gluconokinase